jgi:hypothetical protein
MAYVCLRAPQHCFAPGTVLKVPSHIPGLFHILMVVSPDPLTGMEMVIHSMPGIGVTLAPLLEAMGRKQVLPLWVPATPQQANAAVYRMSSLIGLPYDLFQANCEHVVTWAVTGRWRSGQLAGLTLCAALAGGVFAVASRKRG